VGWEVNDFIHGMGFFQNHFLGMISFAWDSWSKTIDSKVKSCCGYSYKC
jgi:hypothetical protein